MEAVGGAGARAAWGQRLGELLPGRADYRGLRRTWRGDLMAGLTVGIVALPLALAFGVTSGVGAAAGLITAIVAGFIAAIFGGSHVQVSGPTGAMVVILTPIVATHGVSAVALVSLLAGAIVVLAGALRLGRAVGYIPWPVVEGFGVGIGVIIFLQQVPAALGLSGSGLHSNAGIAAWQVIGQAAWPQALLPLGAAAAVVALSLLFERVLPRLPGSFFAIAVVALGAAVLDLPLPVIGELPATLPAPHLPEMNPELLGALLAPALAVAALAAIESLLSMRVASGMADVGQSFPDRELVGQGLASLASGLFGGMPATGAIARTAVNVRAGGRSRLAAASHAILLLALVMFAAQIVSQIPLAALSGVLMVTAARMVSPVMIRTMLRSSRSDAIVFLVTAIVTITVDLVVAVGIGVAVAAVFALRSLSAASGVEREPAPQPGQPGDEHIAIYRIDGALFFGASERILSEVAPGSELRVVILRLSQVHILDATGAAGLGTLIAELESRGTTVLVKGVRPEHAGLLGRLQALDPVLQRNHLFSDMERAVTHARTHVAEAPPASGPE